MNSDSQKISINFNGKTLLIPFNSSFSNFVEQVYHLFEIPIINIKIYYFDVDNDKILVTNQDDFD